MNGIYLSVIVEQHGEVVDAPLHVMMLPRAAYVLGCIALQTLAIDIGKHVELAVGIADGGSPHALAVYLLVVLQRESIVAEIETVEAVSNVLPVHQVLGVKDHQTRHGMHGSARQVVVIAHTQNVGVRELVVEQRVGKRAIAIVGSP